MQPTRYAVRTNHLIDGLHDSILQDQRIIIDNGRIAHVGPAASNEVPDGCVEYDLTDYYVMPGLIDTHVHLVYSSGTYAPLMQRDIQDSLIEKSTLTALANARLYLESGVTTIMDVGTRGNIAVAIRDAVAAGQLPGPRIVASGRTITPTGGVADHLPSWVMDSTNHVAWGVVANGASELRKAVREQAKLRVNNIKLAVGGTLNLPFALHGFLQILTFEEIAATVEAAHSVGLTVAVHAEGSITDAVRAGADTVHHGWALDDEAIDAVLGSKAYYVPTAVKIDEVIRLGPEIGWSPKAIAFLKSIQETYWRQFETGLQRGLADKIVVGADAGTCPPHVATVTEMSVLRARGLGPMDTIKAATSRAAKALHLEQEAGSIASGLSADFLIVDGNPLEDPAILSDATRLIGIVKEGQIYKFPSDQASVRSTPAR